MYGPAVPVCGVILSMSPYMVHPHPCYPATKSIWADEAFYEDIMVSIIIFWLASLPDN